MLGLNVLYVPALASKESERLILISARALFESAVMLFLPSIFGPFLSGPLAHICGDNDIGLDDELVWLDNDSLVLQIKYYILNKTWHF